MRQRSLYLAGSKKYGSLFGRLVFATLVFTIGNVAAQSKFIANKAGELRSGTGIGRVDETIYAPNIRFPLESGPAYANSQVYSIGGYWSHSSNYAFPWWDNFCETRGWVTPMCPSGKGHQGQDIRPADKIKGKHWAVAVESGQVVYISPKPGYVVRIRGTVSGNLYNYLHMEMRRLTVKQGDNVSEGQRLGLVSNDFGGTKTSVHLHFEILQAQKGKSGVTHVSPYTSLVSAYKKLEGAKL